MTIKKISTLLFISLLLLLSASIAWAAAVPEDTTVSFSLTNKTAQAGESFTVYLMVDENSGKGFDVAEFMLSFDNTYLEALNADINPDLSFMFVPNLAKKVEGNKQDIMMVFAGGTPLTGTGGLASLEFKLKDNAPKGTVIDLDFVDSNKVALSTGGTVSFSVNGGKITVGSSTDQEEFPAIVGQVPQTPIPTTTDPGTDPANTTNPSNPTNPTDPGNADNSDLTDPSAQIEPEPYLDNTVDSNPSDTQQASPGQPVSGSSGSGGKNNNAAIIWGIIGALIVAAGIFLLVRKPKNQNVSFNPANSNQENADKEPESKE